MNKNITVKVNGIPYTVYEGTVLSSFVKTDMPCGSHGKCGKCKVKVFGHVSELSQKEREVLTEEELRDGVRLACRTKVMGECSITTFDTADTQVLTDAKRSAATHPMFTRYGIAVDVGTTTVAAALYDTNGSVISTEGALNPQSKYGADVISRIEAALGGHADDLKALICDKISEIVKSLLQKCNVGRCDVDALVITGNTAMLHLLTGTDTEPLSHAPFKAKRLFGEYVNIAALGIDGLADGAVCYLPPCIGSFVGADTLCALLTVKKEGTFLLTDIGTNGEIVLFKDGNITACSTAAGPAFEGAGIKMGMRANNGAVDKVSIVNGRLFAHVIGDTEPVGICGSGLIDAVSCLLKTEELDETGYLENDVVILPPVVITPEDIRMVQLAKSAVRAGIQTLITKHGTTAKALEKIYVAGGFGHHLDIENVMTVGLLPRIPKSRVEFIGNAALTGAGILLTDKTLHKECEELAKNTLTAELATDPIFTENYIEYMMF